MKKLLTTAAICGLVVAASPAHAELDLGIGGYTKMYGVYNDSDDNSATAQETRDFDIIRNTEIHLSGETTLDNGLTVGFHTELDADGNNAGDLDAQESYAYFSGGWGRVNVGSEDGAAYLLQVAAPSADSNVDGIRQFVSPANYGDEPAGSGLLNFSIGTGFGTEGVDYDQDLAGYADKITYLSPIMNGFQIGLSYTPDSTDASNESLVDLDDVADAFGTGYEAAVRYEGVVNDVGVILGAGYSQLDLENEAVTAAADPSDDRTAWNIGGDLDIGPFGIGVIYMEDDFGESDVDGTAGGAVRSDEETLVVGVDYTTGPFKLGASYMDQDGSNNVVGNTGNDGIETERWTGGVVYTYGPGMTFRGSISYVEHDNVSSLTAADGDSFDATSVLVGTQINF